MERSGGVAAIVCDTTENQCDTVSGVVRQVSCDRGVFRSGHY